MIVNKQIVSASPIEVKFTGITLLSKEEYEANGDIIPAIYEWWWLRSPGNIQDYAKSVQYAGSPIGNRVDFTDICVRPALYISNPQSSNLHRGDKFELAGHMWTVLSNDLALCDDVVGQTYFREDWRADDANDYEKSNIKKWLHKWAENNGIEFCDAVGESKK